MVFLFNPTPQFLLQFFFIVQWILVSGIINDKSYLENYSRGILWSLLSKYEVLHGTLSLLHFNYNMCLNFIDLFSIFVYKRNLNMPINCIVWFFGCDGFFCRKKLITVKFFFCTGDFMKKVPTATCALRDR